MNQRQVKSNFRKAVSQYNKMSPQTKKQIQRKRPTIAKDIKTVQDALGHYAKGNISKRKTRNYIDMQKRAGLQGKNLQKQMKYQHREKVASTIGAHAQAGLQGISASRTAISGIEVANGQPSDSSVTKDGKGVAE